MDLDLNLKLWSRPHSNNRPRPGCTIKYEELAVDVLAKRIAGTVIDPKYLERVSQYTEYDLFRQPPEDLQNQIILAPKPADLGGWEKKSEADVFDGYRIVGRLKRYIYKVGGEPTIYRAAEIMTVTEEERVRLYRFHCRQN